MSPKHEPLIKLFTVTEEDDTDVHKCVNASTSRRGCVIWIIENGQWEDTVQTD